MSAEELRRYATLLETALTEGLDDPVRVGNAQQFATLLDRTRYGTLRAFLDGSELWAWDAEKYIHPDAVDEHGLDGIPLQLSRQQIEIRLHGIPAEQYREVYQTVHDNPTVQRIYGGHLPPIYSDSDGDEPQERLDGLWDDETDEDETKDDAW